MKYMLIFFSICFLSCTQEKKETTTNLKSDNVLDSSIDIDTIALEIHDFNGIEKYLNFEDDKTYVINFWATWCAPCVKELPYFEKLGANYQSDKVEVILVSLDFPRHYDSKLKPFIIDKKLMSKVVVLNDVDSNTWIPKVDENWSGAIPATLIYNKSKRQFYEQSFTYTELETELKNFLNL